MGFFPTSPSNDDEIGPNTHGTYFKYNATDDRWYIIANIVISNVDYNEGTWDANLDGATKNVIRDKIVTMDAEIVANCTTVEAIQAVEDAGLVLSVDKTISFDANPADTKYSGFCIDIDTTGCNLYDLVFVDAANSVAPADASDDTKMPAIGIVVAVGKVLTHGVVKDDDLIKCTTPKAVVYASTTLREVTETAPSGVNNMIQVVGICTEDHTLFVNVSLDMVKFV